MDRAIGERGISPVLGSVIMLGIGVMLVSVSAYLILGVTSQTSKAPDAALTLEQTGDATFTLRHESGDNLTGGLVEIQGVANEDALDGLQFTPTDTIELTPVSDRVRLVWHGNNTHHTIHEFKIETKWLPYNTSDTDTRCDAAASNIKDDGTFGLDGDTVVCDVLGDVGTGTSSVGVDLESGATLVGNIDTDSDVTVETSTVVGNVTTAGDTLTISGSDIYGDVVAPAGTTVDIDGGTVHGSVVAAGSVSLDGVSVDTHVHATGDALSCTGGTTVGSGDVPCSEYTLRNPDDY
jgi:FlaG/FlaF family flagellin (archaellin)